MHCIPCASFNLLFIQHKIFATTISRIPSKLNDSHRMQRPVWRKTSHKPHSHIPLHYLSPLACARVYFEHSPVPNCSYKVYQFVRQPMLHHLDRLPSSVRFGLLPLSFQRFFEILLFVLQKQPGRPADRQPGKPTGCRHCKLSFAFASCSNASHLPQLTPPLPQLPSYWQWLNVARLRVASQHRIASHRIESPLFAARLCLPSLYLLSLLLPSPTWHIYHIWFRAARLERFPSLLCLPLDNCAADCPHFRLEIILKTFTQLALYMCPVRLSAACLSIRLSVRLSCLSIAFLLLLLLLLHWLSASRCLLHRIACSAACFCLAARPRPHLACGSALCLRFSLCSLNACSDRTLLQLHWEKLMLAIENCLVLYFILF